MRSATRKTRFLLLVVALGLAAARSAAASTADGDSAASPATLHLVLPSGPLQATDQFQWKVRIRVVNSTPRGIYTDSLVMEFTDLYEGSMRRGYTESFSVTKVAELLRAVSAGDSGYVTYSGAAFAETGRIRMRLHAHFSDGTTCVTPAATIDIGPAPMAVRFPSSYIQGKDGRIEITFLPEMWPTGPSPAVLLVHGEDSQSRDWMPLGCALSNRGYACMLVSLPGHGFSTGPRDFAGPASVKAVSRALDLLRRLPGTDSTRVGLWGFSEGATVAALVAARHGGVRGLVLQSGIYDLASTFEHTESAELRRILETQAGPRAGWKKRSPLRTREWPQAPALILHGEEDRVVPASQAGDFAAGLRAAGDSVTVRLFPGAGHQIPMAEARDTVEEFFKSLLLAERKAR
jgi:dipeptidyl aminopeptidase/acylaminoacyl peptidase